MLTLCCHDVVSGPEPCQMMCMSLQEIQDVIDRELTDVKYNTILELDNIQPVDTNRPPGTPVKETGKVAGKGKGKKSKCSKFTKL